MGYAYWAVICKTPQCGKTLLLKGGYIGRCGATAVSVKVKFQPSDPLDLLCPACDKAHRYTHEDFLVTRMDRRVEPSEDSEV